MELAIIPLIGLTGLYIISNQEKTSTSSREGYRNEAKERLDRELLPNMDVPNVNYPSEYPLNQDPLTSKLSIDNSYNGPSVYTDKYFKNPYQEHDARDRESMHPTTAFAAAPGIPNTYPSLTGENVQLDYFRHNNMAPFFGSKSHELNAPNALESTLDNYAGAGSQTISKREQAPLFRPGENYQWANGMPSSTEFVQSRMNPSLRQANVKPFQDIKVGPGLGLGFTAEAQGGFNSGMMAREQWVDRTVDDLRVANKQKASGLGLYGFEGPAGGRIQNLGDIGHVEKNRVERTFEMGQDRLLTTTGLEKAPTLRPVTLARPVTRPDTTTSYTGTAQALTPGEYVMGEYMPPHAQALGPVPLAPAAATGRSGATSGDYGIQAYAAGMLDNNRTTGNPYDYFGAVGGALGAVVAPLLDMLRPSRKENIVGTLRPYQNARAPVQKSYTFNPNDRPATTIRESTEESNMHWNIDANQRGGGYESTPHQMSKTYRAATENVEYVGNAEGALEPRLYNDAYRQRNNEIKSSTIAGRLVPGNMALMNGHVNMSSKATEDVLINRRPMATGMKFAETPSTSSMGVVQGVNDLYGGMQLDRADGDVVLSQLKKNPYVIAGPLGVV